MGPAAPVAPGPVETPSCFLVELGAVMVGRALQGAWKHLPNLLVFPLWSVLTVLVQ